MKTKLLISFCVLMLAVQPAFALRCGHKLVREGADKIEVIKKCGEPLYVEDKIEYRLVIIENRQDGFYSQEEEEVPVKIEEWTYNYNFGRRRFSPRRLMRLLRFEDGKLIEIESIGYGDC